MINIMTYNLRKRTNGGTDWYSYDATFGSKAILGSGWYKDPSDAKEEILRITDALRSFNFKS